MFFRFFDGLCHNYAQKHLINKYKPSKRHFPVGKSKDFLIFLFTEQD